ncbi:hypothetical protein PanWU01x14_265300, partial [Parasponia andersonii]
APLCPTSIAVCMPSRMLVVEIYASPLSLGTCPERGRVALCEPVGTRDSSEHGRMTSRGSSSLRFPVRNFSLFRTMRQRSDRYPDAVNVRLSILDNFLF